MAENSWQMMPREIPEHMRFQRPSQIRPHSPDISGF